MTNPDFRALCAELLAALEIQLDELRFNNRLCVRARAALAEPELCNLHREMVAESVARRARAVLAQPEPVAPTDEEIDEWADAATEVPLEEMDPDVHVLRWRRCFTAKEFNETIRAALARWGNSREILDSSPQPVWADIHYAWELEDAEGEWQAGGSANSLEDVQREGNRYLQTYAQDGPHKLIIQRHCVNTIEEVTND